MQNEVLRTIKSRRSVRAFEPDLIPDELLALILEAGQAAPYVMPDSRHFSVLRDRALISRLSETAKTEGMKLGDFQREMFGAPGFDGTYGAPIAVILSGNEATIQYEAVCAASAQNMLIATKSLGIESCWAYFPIFAFHGGDADMWRKELRIPSGYKPCISVLIGYGADGSAPGPVDRYKNEISYI